MLESYLQLSNIERVLKSENNANKDELARIQAVLYQDKDYFITKIESYLKEEIGCEYKYYKVKDFNGNNAHILVKQGSKIFSRYIEDVEVLNFDIEELIDSIKFDNSNEIVILDMNFDDNHINIGYICLTLDYYFSSYSDGFKKILGAFMDYVITTRMSILSWF